jgi:hypothetical protein
MGFVLAAALVSVAAPAYAQSATEGEIVTAPMRAPRKAFELQIDTGYSQGFGALYKNRPMRDVAGPGLALGLGLGYRATSVFSVELTGEFQGLSRSLEQPEGTMIRGGAVGIATTFHAASHERADPWVSLGAGYRLLGEVLPGSAPNTLTHGIELGKLQVGIDLRPTDSVAIAPTVGADLDMFMWRNSSGARTADLTERALSGFVFAGVRGRFDMGGKRTLRVETAAR